MSLLAAGVLYYFEEPEIKAFLLRLVERFPGSEILFDVCSPTGVRVANKKVIENAGMDEKSYLQWWLKNPQEMLAWHPGIQLIKTYHYFQSFDMSIRNILLGRLSDFLGIQYMLHLKLGR